MPGMNITFQGGMYELVIDNLGSVQLVDVETVVELLANSMAGGIDLVVANAADIFAVGDLLPADQIAAMFNAVDVLLLEGVQVFDAAALGATILDEIVAAGADLLLVI